MYLRGSVSSRLFVNGLDNLRIAELKRQKRVNPGEKFTFSSRFGNLNQKTALISKLFCAKG
jgi:hypothetical protein